MSLAPGRRLVSYEIISALGAGGMGEVYRARDTKLNRDVAIKVLLPAVANDPDRLARFSREAQVLASLNHPNIAHIHGLEESNGVTALVMELVEGDDLSQRIARGAIPIDEALPIARQIAEALEAAHECGIIHRDLKPANIKVRPDGTVKVLDFGLAKAVGQGSGIGDQGSVNAANSPTLSIHATEAGIILGTAAYMSPEQAAGKSVDKRSDLWAFGVVLLEMLTGRQVFKGETVSHVMAAVLKDEPDWSSLPINTPAAVRRLLRRCLEKDRKHRLPDAADIRLEIDEAPEPARASARRPHPRLLVFGSILAGGLLVGAAFWLVGRNPSSSAAGAVRFAVHDTDQVVISRGPREVAISPDGRLLAFIGFGEGGPRIWIRALDAIEARPLPGTEGAVSLCWSPDSQSVAFSAAGQIKTTPVAGGSPQVVAAPRMNILTGFAWGRGDTIIHTGLRGGWVINIKGGPPVNIMPMVSNESYDSAAFLPDGRHFLIAIHSPDSAKAGTFSVGIDGGERTRILEFPTTARYALGHLMFVRDGVLYAQPFDLTKRQLEGTPVPLAESVAAAFSASDTGAIAYLPLIASQQAASTQLSWMDRTGRVLGRIEQAGGAANPALSRDGRRLAMNLRTNLWVFELERAVLSRVTSGTTSDFSPSWLPDNQRLVFHRTLFRNGQDAILSTVVGSAAKETVVYELGPDAGIHAHPTDVSADGRYLAYETDDRQVTWVRALAGDPAPTRHGPATSAQTQGVFSPDGRWLSYTSDSSGRFEVYVDAVPEPGTRIQVSANGGNSARWSRDGRELFYLTPDDTLMAVPIRSTQPLEFGQPAALFRFASAGRGLPAGKPPYDVAADGQRFIVNAVVRQNDPSQHVLLNWPALTAARSTP
jgi:Tol biopolymer transport system component